MPDNINVISSPITALGLSEQCALMISWAHEKQSRVICVANVHMLLEAHKDQTFANILKHADLVTPDGMPLVWMMRLLGAPRQERVAGLDIFLSLCALSEQKGLSIFLLGSTMEVLTLMKERLSQNYPALHIAGIESPPFRPLSNDEDEALIKRINDSGANLLFVALGCPKQERWMDMHRGKIHSVMIGLGGAFPVYAGIQKRAPVVIQQLGLEWVFRLAQEPRRLWKRYWETNIPFILLAALQLIRGSNR